MVAAFRLERFGLDLDQPARLFAFVAELLIPKHFKLDSFTPAMLVTPFLSSPFTPALVFSFTPFFRLLFQQLSSPLVERKVKVVTLLILIPPLCFYV